jgi:hypothetical protein
MTRKASERGPNVVPNERAAIFSGYAAGSRMR